MAETRVKQRRRCFRYSLRTLFVLTLAIGCGFGWLMGQRQRIAAARESLTAAGFGPDDHWETEPLQPVWHEQLFGDDWPHFTRNIFAVDPDRINDEALGRLHGLTQLRSVTIKFRSTITDAGLAHLRSLTSLSELFLEESDLSDAALQHLEGLKELKFLDLTGCSSVTDAGLQHLKGLGQLRFLGLFNTEVTESGVEELRRVLPNCTVCR